MSKTIDEWIDPEYGEVELQTFEAEDDFVLICNDNEPRMSDYDYLHVAMRRLAQLAKEREGKVLVDESFMRQTLEVKVGQVVAFCKWPNCQRTDGDELGRGCRPHNGTCPLAD